MPRVGQKLNSTFIVDSFRVKLHLHYRMPSRQLDISLFDFPGCFVHFPLPRLSLLIMRTWFYQPTAKRPGHTQGIARKQKRVKLTKEARAAITARQREASRHYQRDLDEAWAKIGEATESIATAHHKSVRHVQSELHMRPSIAHKNHSKTSAWNAFSWKKNNTLKGEKGVVDESRQFTFYILFLLLIFHLDSPAGGDDVGGMNFLIIHPTTSVLTGPLKLLARRFCQNLSAPTGRSITP